MSRLRIVIATLVAPLVPLLAFYGLGLVMDGPDPVADRELKRIAFLAVPGLLLVYPWALAGGLGVVLVLRRLRKNSLTAFGTGGFLLGAIPGAIGAWRSGAIDPFTAVGVFGVGGLLLALAWRALSAYRPVGF